MKKNFVRVMLFGALTLAVTTTVTSCKDNDDDIKNLQEQIDKITSASPVSTDDMNAAVDKASKELKEQLAKLEKLVNDPSSETSLTQQIKDLESALETAVGKDAEDLAGKLVAAQTDLANLKKALGGDDYIKGLKKKIDDLESAKATMQALIDAEAAYKLDNKDLSGYKNTGFGAYVNQEILNAIEKGGSIAGYVDNAVKTGVGSVLKGVNEYLSANFEKNADLEAFVKKVNETLFSDTYKEKMAKLDDFLLAIDNAVKNGSDYDSYEDVINQIDATKEQLASLELPSGEGVTFDSAVKAIVETKLGTVNSRITTLGERLQKEIDAIKGMIQSIVYVPAYADGQVQFNTFYAQFGNSNNGNDWKPVVNVDEVKVRFRVSPAEVIEDLVACFGEDGKENENAKYDVSVDCQEVQTRSLNDPFKIKGIKAVGTAEPNLIEVTLDASAVEHSYAVALTVKDNVPADKNTLNDVSSNYFAAVKSDLYITKVVWAPKAEPTTLVKGQSIDYKTDGDYTLTVATKMNASNGSTSDTDSRTKPSEYGISTDMFSVAFSVNNTTDFTLGDTDEEMAKGVLAGKAAGTAGNKGKVTSTVTVTNPNNGEETKVYDGTEHAEVTLVIEGTAQTVELASDVTPLWNSIPKSYMLDATGGSATEAAVTAIKAALGNIQNFQDCEFEGVVDGQTIMLGKGDEPGYNLVLKVPAKTVCATTDITTRIISQDGSKSINVTVKNVTVSYPEKSQVALTLNEFSWDGKTAVLSQTVSENPIAKIEATRTLTELFSNYTKVNGIVTPLGGAIEFNLKKVVSGVTLNKKTGEIVVGNSYSYKNPIIVIVTVKCGDKPEGVLFTSAEIPVAIPVDEFNGTFGYAEVAEGEEEGVLTLDVAKGERGKPVTLSSALVWKDATEDANEIWPTAAKGVYKDNKPMAIYGFKVEAANYKFVDGPNNEYFTLANGQLTLISDIANGSQNTKAIEVKVTVTPQSPWGDMSSQAKVVTLKVPTWKD